MQDRLTSDAELTRHTTLMVIYQQELVLDNTCEKTDKVDWDELGVDYEKARE